MRQVSLCLLIKENEDGVITQVLLAMKKRGFGKGKWNGVGGKPKDGEKILNCAIRETEEEIRVKPYNLQKVGIFDFHFPEDKKDFDQQVHLFLVRRWEGEPQETEEMKPQWFEVEDLPFGEMWDDDISWFPFILEGDSIEAEFRFDKDNKVIDHTIRMVEELA